MKQQDSVSPNICPLCGGDNLCGQLPSGCGSETCWCAAGDVSFPDSLLKQIPASAKNKACICKACVMAHIDLANEVTD